jgi:hypothetical protein
MHPHPDLSSPAFSAHSHAPSQPHPLNQHSTILSTPGTTPFHAQVVHFEEFQASEERPSLKGQGRKKLTI